MAQVFEFGAALQALYVRAGYPLVRVIDGWSNVKDGLNPR
jgi:hypothetical protein